MKGSIDLVVAAGGDGTVRRAANAIAGLGIPLAILPLGTANNIARSIGIDDPIPQLIHDWGSARRYPFDLGVVRGAWGESRFLEGTGGGLIPAGIGALKAELNESRADADSKLARALRGYREALSLLQPCRWALTVDDTRLEDDFLLVEVLNIRSVGANLVLAPDADPSDGYLSVVTATEEHRNTIAEYLQHRIEGKDCRLSLPTRSARRIEIHGLNIMHVDDQLVRWPAIEAVSATIEAGALEVLV